MLSAAVILVVFAVIALAGAGSAVWLYRAAAASAWRAQPAQRQPSVESAVATGVTARATADLAAGPDPGWPGPPAEPGSGWPVSQETTPGDDEELGVVWEAPAGMTANHPGPPAAPEQVYDLAAWPDLDSAGDGPDDSGSRGPRAWPDLARSLYSRGWPAMDSPPSAASGWPRSRPRPHPEPSGSASDGPSSGGAASVGPSSAGSASDGPSSGGSASDGPGPAGSASDGPSSGGSASDGPGPAGSASDGPSSGGAASDGPGPGGPGGPGSGGPSSNSLAPNSLNLNRADPSGPEPDGPDSDGRDSDGPDLDTASNRPGPIGDGWRYASPSLPCLHSLSAGPSAVRSQAQARRTPSFVAPRERCAAAHVFLAPRGRRDERNGPRLCRGRGNARVYVLGKSRRPRP